MSKELIIITTSLVLGYIIFCIVMALGNDFGYIDKHFNQFVTKIFQVDENGYTTFSSIFFSIYQRGSPTKSSSRIQKKEWIEDYYLQIAAYAMAHDYVYGSKIQQGVIMVCTPDLYYQEFKVQGAELKAWKHKFLKMKASGRC